MTGPRSASLLIILQRKSTECTSVLNTTMRIRLQLCESVTQYSRIVVAKTRGIEPILPAACSSHFPKSVPVRPLRPLSLCRSLPSDT